MSDYENPPNSIDDAASQAADTVSKSIDNLRSPVSNPAVPDGTPVIVPRTSSATAASVFAPAKAPFIANRKDPSQNAIASGENHTVVAGSSDVTPIQHTPIQHTPMQETPIEDGPVQVIPEPQSPAFEATQPDAVPNVGIERDDLPPVPRHPAGPGPAPASSFLAYTRTVPPSIENRTHNPAAFGTDGAVVSFAVAQNIATQTENVDQSRPSFNSSFARVPADQQRPLYDRTGMKRQRLRGAVLDDTVLGTRHEWMTTIVESLALTRFVLTPDVFNRRDMQRLRMLYDKDPQSVREIWSRKRSQRDWFQIPSTLQCDRTFARDPSECYYLSRMDELLASGDLEEATNSPPLLKDPLIPRWWSAFRHRCDFYREGWYRHSLGVLVPHDDPDVQQWDPTNLMDEYPKVPPSYKSLQIPHGLPVPTPPSAWYYHYELVHGDASSPRHKILHQQVFEELVYLAIATWYNEFKHGDRMFIIPPRAIERMRTVVGCKRISPGVHTPEIIQYMWDARRVDSNHWNEMRFSDEKFPVSYFVDSLHGRVASNIREIGGRVVSVSTRSRKIYDDLRQTRRLEQRNSAVLPLKLYQNDITQIPGLIAIAREQNWMLQRGVSVQSTIENLLQKINGLEFELQTERSQRYSTIVVPAPPAEAPASPDGPAF